MCCFPLSLFSSVLPSIPPIILCWLLCLFFPFVCSDRPLPLIDSDGRLTPLHNAADIFPTGDPTVAAAAAAAALSCIR